jgi:hypothetical protein
MKKMITKIDSSNEKLYKDLFAKAAAALASDHPNIEIDSLETYFTYIEELRAKDLKYTMLPI